MTNPDLDKLARGLTEAQREAILTRPSAHKVWGNPDMYCVVMRAGTLNALYGKGLIQPGSDDTHVRLSETGLALRAHIERTERDG